MRAIPRARASHLARDAGDLIRRVREVAWRYPEWWSIALSVTAWVMLFGRAHAAAFEGGGEHRHLAAGVPAWMASSLDSLLMVVAMMVPLVLGPIRVTAARSLWARRHRAVGGFLTGYLAPWSVFGIVLATVAAALHDRVAPPAAGAAAFAIAALWQLTPTKRRALRACHQTLPLAPRGWRADRDCLRYGWMIGARCLGSCWALMAACILAGHSVPAMVCAGSVGIAERYMARPDPRLLCAAVLAFGVTYAVAVLNGWRW